MAWNKPSAKSGEANSCSLKKQSGKHFPVKSVIAGVVFVLGTAMIALFVWLKRENVDDQPDDRPTKVIQAVEPAKARVATNIVEDLPLRTNSSGRVIQTPKVTVDDKGRKWFMGAPVPDSQPGDYFQDGVRQNKPEIFEHPYENYLHQTLLSDIGTPSSAPPELPVRVLAEMKKGLRIPVIIYAEDSPEVAQAKRDLNTLKLELADRVDAGESLEDILRDAQTELNRYAAMRDNYQNGFHELMRSGASKQELKDYMDAANTILDRNGVQRLDVTPLLKKKLEQLDPIGEVK